MLGPKRYLQGLSSSKIWKHKKAQPHTWYRTDIFFACCGWEASAVPILDIPIIRPYVPFTLPNQKRKGTGKAARRYGVQWARNPQLPQKRLKKTQIPVHDPMRLEAWLQLVGRSSLLLSARWI